MRQDPSSFAYTDVGEGREQDAEASSLTSLGMTGKSVNYFQCMMKDAETLMDNLENLELLAMAEERKDEGSIKVDINEL